MAACPLQLDVGPAPFVALPAISAIHGTVLFPEEFLHTNGFEALSRRGIEEWSGKSQELQDISADELQKCLWQRFVSNPTEGWDNKTLLNSGTGKPLASFSTARHAVHDGDLAVKMCTNLCKHGQITDAVNAVHLLTHRGCKVPMMLLYNVLKRCIAQKDLVLGRRVHAMIVKAGFEGHAFLATHLIGLYATDGRLEEAMQVFNEVSSPDAYNWSAIIFAYARHGEARQAIRLYQQMRQSTVKPDNHIFLAVLKACASAGDLVAGKDVHAHLLVSEGEPDIFVQTGLVDMYAKCGSIEEARTIFDRLPHKDVVTWNAMFGGYAQQGKGHEALSLYRTMRQIGTTPPSHVSFVCLLQACSSVGDAALPEGKEIHSQISERGLQCDVVLGGSLVNMYAKCGSLQDARSVFDRLTHKNVVAWNTMIAGYAQQRMGLEALSVYTGMLQKGNPTPDAVTFLCVLQACSFLGVDALHQGKQIHAQIEKRGLQGNVDVGSSLVNMYAKCGSVGEARRVFDGLAQKDGVTWTAMIAGYAQQEMGEEALSIYGKMEQAGVAPPDAVTYVCLLQACANVSDLPLGTQLHTQIKRRGFESDATVLTALVHMYAKCGSMFESQQAFDSLPERSIEAWSALIAGYSRQGDSEIVFDLVARMRREGIQPNGITFVSLLTLCSHVGLVDKGREYFRAMTTECGICPTIEHYVCMMDLLGRAGNLAEALVMGKSMFLPPNAAVWHSLLGACQKWNNVEIGRQAFDLAVSLDDKDASSYIMMSNIYAAAQMWEEEKEITSRRLKFKARKQQGQSWCADLVGRVQTFSVGDHPDVGEDGSEMASQAGNEARQVKSSDEDAS